jgi:hypothetical protein
MEEMIHWKGVIYLLTYLSLKFKSQIHWIPSLYLVHVGDINLYGFVLKSLQQPKIKSKMVDSEEKLLNEGSIINIL